MYCSQDGTAKFLRPGDMADRMKDGLNAFDIALAEHRAKDPVTIPKCKCTGWWTKLVKMKVF